MQFVRHSSGQSDVKLQELALTVLDAELEPLQVVVEPLLPLKRLVVLMIHHMAFPQPARQSDSSYGPAQPAQELAVHHVALPQPAPELGVYHVALPQPAQPRRRHRLQLWQQVRLLWCPSCARCTQAAARALGRLVKVMDGHVWPCHSLHKPGWGHATVCTAKVGLAQQLHTSSRCKQAAQLCTLHTRA